ncbi:MAG: DNA polymerase III subunit epsilon [Holosporales bacterium]|jgi:DNA polymerase-3 subunit epsilon|nr:DNA polymerase III subunit epsilon [Holosporales bacterium]
MREISLDTETTGLSVTNGDRITEIGCVEIIDKRVTGKFFHSYVNPEKEVSKEAEKISGLTYDFLKSHPKFKEICDEFLNFIKDSRLVIHNASFDIEFLNMELKEAGTEVLKNDRVVDTLAIARQKYPGSPSTLDALCKKFSINASKRIKHGALIDAELLAEVYIVMSVEKRQKDIFSSVNYSYDYSNSINRNKELQFKLIQVSDDELSLHNEFLKKIKNSIWENINKC